ncbi:hypothetical protein B0H10DRAFT_1962590 [Mycena sp. CBHHK59/15]|nr:hypothetical protein B0H10DRAFT_1962590 [Mycena sp. CBHHK59/15]
MAEVRRSSGQLFRRLHGFQTHDPAITMRSISRSGTASALNTEGNRKDGVIKDVRTRDRKCRATGQVAPYGSRGLNFSGLEVAHIYPLGSVEKILIILSRFEFRVSVSRSVCLGCTSRSPVHPLGLPFSPRKKDIDIVQNAMVLRGDVHSQFDEYQFGFVTYRDPTSSVGPYQRILRQD